MPRTTDFSKAVVGKSRRKTKAAAVAGNIVTMNRRAAGFALTRKAPPGVRDAEVDQFGLLRASKYRNLDQRCRENVAWAIREHFEYQGTSATTEEQVCYGELRRRGFELGLGAGNKSFQPQSPIAGSIVDFEVWLASGGEKHALRPMNEYWHGHMDKINHDDEKGEEIVAKGYVLDDIWSGDSLVGLTLVVKFDQFFGAA